MPDPYARPMGMLAKPVLIACLTAVALTGAVAGVSARDRAVTASRQNVRVLPVREIERLVIPRLRGAQYLGFDFDPQTSIYTLKFLRNGSVIWVDVDGRTGRILRQTGGN
ncbi:MAG: hypothetical protein V4574_04300 [Pseudomonadota bacterium]